MTDSDTTDESSTDRETAGSAPAIPDVTGDLVDGDGQIIGELETNVPLPARPSFDVVTVMRALSRFKERIGGDVNIGLVENQQGHDSPVLALWSESEPARALLVAPRVDRSPVGGSSVPTVHDASNGSTEPGESDTSEYELRRYIMADENDTVEIPDSAVSIETEEIRVRPDIDGTVLVSWLVPVDGDAR
jgi:hypothetical protein